MSRLSLCLFLLFCTCSESKAASLKINLICPANGKGLEVDGMILQKALISLGCYVNRLQGNENGSIPMADVNLFCEQLNPSLLPYAHLNWFIPNPEWYIQDLRLLEKIDLILSRTKEVERIFTNLGKNTFFLGFTSPDAYLPDVRKDFNAFIHVAGASPLKGTWPTCIAWEKNNRFPLLTVISIMIPPEPLPPNLFWVPERLSREDLRLKQNQCGVHLCLSGTEGFGHYLVEAMSSGAVVITTDAPPMNEFIQDSRYLVPYQSTSQQNLGITYGVSSEAIEEKIHHILNLPLEELRVAGAKNRANYVERNRQFHENLRYLITTTQGALHQTSKGRKKKRKNL